MDEEGVIKEDIQARQFIEKIYPPIHQVGEKIHENILEKCKNQTMKIAKGDSHPPLGGARAEREDKTEKYVVKVKEEAAHNSWMDIRFMKSHTRPYGAAERSDTSNGTFRKELAILSNV